MTQTELAAKTGRSTAYVNQLITGHKKPSPEWVDLIADTMKLSPKDRQALHVAAAKQPGPPLRLVMGGLAAARHRHHMCRTKGG